MAFDMFNRRQIITGSLAALASGDILNRTSSTEGVALPKRVLRFAHLTDVHVQTDRAGDKGFAAALAHVQQQPDPPELVMFGGDNVMNVDSDDGAAKADQQLATWKRCLKNELSLPYRICIGNHDVWKLHPTDGKRWAVDSFELDHRYYAFDQSGWRFLVLDSTSPEEGGYKGRLDPEQLEWLNSTIGQTDPQTPIIIVSHIPILAACAYFDGNNEQSGNWNVPGAWMHIDGRAIKELFRQHGNVRVALSGHIHLIDEVRYNETTYYCNGAVSGGWWKGPYQEFGPGYALIDLFEDGSSSRTFVHYPWSPQD